MPSASPPTEQFWLLTGEVPSGPFTVEQIHAKIASGDATWQTPACPVGGSNWLPLVQTPGVGPGTTSASGVSPASDAGEHQGHLERPIPPPLPVPGPTPAASSPVPAAPAADPPAEGFKARSARGVRRRLLILLAVVAVVSVGAYWLYDAVRPRTATEVCKKLDEVKTAAEAKQFVTPRMHPLVDAVYADNSGLDPNDTFAWTEEVDGPQPGTKHVGFRGSFLLPEAGRRVAIEGHFRLIRSDGWKVDDMVVTAVEGASLPGPVSLAEEYAPPVTALVACRRLNSAKSAAEAKKYATARMYPLVDAIAADKSSPDPNDAFEITQEVDGGDPSTRKVGFRGSWYDQQVTKRVAVEGHFRVVSSGGWKVDDMVFTGIEGTALPQPMSLVEEHRRTAPQPPVNKDKLAKTAADWAKSNKSPTVKLPSPAQRPWYEIDEKLRLRLLVVVGILIVGGLGKLIAFLRQRSAAHDRGT